MLGLWGPQNLMNKKIAPIDADFANIFFKPIAHYLANPETAEVMVNAHNDIWVEDDTGLHKVPETFTEDALVSAVNSLAQYVGRPLIENVYAVDARMPDGSRVCIVLPPVSGKDPIFAIRKFKEIVSDLEFMVKRKTLTTEMVDLIDSFVKIKKNIMVSGGTSSGKTTLLNLIAAKIPDEERIITIEDSRELQLKQEHVLSLEARPADKHGKGEFAIRQCLKSTLRLRPDRIIVGEIRSGEAFDLVQAMNTGHGGCMGTVHANTPTDTLRRIESLALMADVDMPLVALRSMIASALDVIICPARLSDGSRRIVQIAEIGPLTEKGDYQTFDIVRFVSTSRNKVTGKIEGYFEFTGHVPSFFELFEAEGVPVPREFFRKRVMGDVPPHLIPQLLEKGYEVPGMPRPEQATSVFLPAEAQIHNVPFQQDFTAKPVEPKTEAVALQDLSSQAQPEAQYIPIKQDFTAPAVEAQAVSINEVAPAFLPVFDAPVEQTQVAAQSETVIHQFEETPSTPLDQNFVEEVAEEYGQNEQVEEPVTAAVDPFIPVEEDNPFKEFEIPSSTQDIQATTFEEDNVPLREAAFDEEVIQEDIITPPAATTFEEQTQTSQPEQVAFEETTTEESLVNQTNFTQNSFEEEISPQVVQPEISQAATPHFQQAAFASSFTEQTAPAQRLDTKTETPQEPTKRPSILERLSKLSSSLPMPEPEPHAPDVQDFSSLPVSENVQSENENNFQQSLSSNLKQADELTNSLQPETTDDYQATPFAFEEEAAQEQPINPSQAANQEFTQELPLSEPSFNGASSHQFEPQVSQNNMFQQASNEQASQPLAQETKQADSKSQNAVIAEILRRMRENRTTEG